MSNGAIWIWILLQLGVLGYVWYRNRGARRMTQPVERKCKPRTESREMKELECMRKRTLNTPLSEKARPGRMNEIVGQEDALLFRN